MFCGIKSAGWLRTGAPLNLSGVGNTAIGGKIHRPINQSKTYIVSCHNSDEIKERLEKLFLRHHLLFTSVGESRAQENFTVMSQLQGHLKNHESVISILMKDPDVIGFSY